MSEVSSTTDPLEESPIPAGGKQAESLVILNTGDGKGKSTSAFGMMCRAVGSGFDVCVIQFIKSAKWEVGEEIVGKKLGVTWHKVGDGFTWDSKDLEHDKAIARKGWKLAADIIASGKYQMVILDEITYLMNWDWVDSQGIITAIINRPKHVNIIATGRDGCQELIDIADTVTEMAKVKHAYDEGILAKAGIDY